MRDKIRLSDSEFNQPSIGVDDWNILTFILALDIFLFIDRMNITIIDKTFIVNYQ